MSTRSCRAILLFALKREAAPLIAHAELQPAWLEQFHAFALLRAIPEPADVIEPSADDIILGVSGVGAAKATNALDRLLRHFPNPGVVIAAGFCGALQSGRQVGEVAIPAEVVDEAGTTWACACVPGVPQHGRLLTMRSLIGDPGAKAVLHEHYHAEFVDMESAAIAAACEQRGLPFAAIRAVSDASDTALSSKLVDLLAEGDVSVWRACLAIVKKPTVLHEFRRLARDTKLAANRLAAVLVRLLGPPCPVPDGPGP